MNRLKLVALRWNMREKAYRLDRKTLETRSDEVTVVAGEAAAATALADIVIGTSDPGTGQIWLGDQDVSEKSDRDREIGLVPPDGGLFPHLSVRDNIAAGLAGRRGEPGADEERLVDGGVSLEAERLGLEGFLEHRPYELAPSVRLRVALARALCSQVRAIVIEARRGLPEFPSGRAVAALALRSYPDKGVLLVTDDAGGTEPAARIRGEGAADAGQP